MIVIGITILIVFHREYFELQYLKTNVQLAKKWAHKDILPFTVGYLILFIASLTFCIPLGKILSVLGGVIYGTLIGSIVVGFATAAGATGTFLVARYFLRDSVKAKFPGFHDKLTKRINEDGAFYLLLLRFAPVIPFPIVNSVMGLTKLRAVVFFAVSFFGTLPATIFFVSAGEELSQLQNFQDLFSAKLFLTFGILFAATLLGKFILKKKNEGRS